MSDATGAKSPAAMVEACRAELARRPDHADTWYDLGYYARRAGAYEDALDAYAKALSLGIRNPWEVHLNRAVIYSDDLRRDQAARAELERALALKPDYLAAKLNLGNLLEEQGEKCEARAVYEAMLEAFSPDGPPGRDHDMRLEALARLAGLVRPDSPDDPVLRRLAASAQRPRTRDPHVAANLSFALGRALDGFGAYDAAFAALKLANARAAATAPAYQPERTQHLFEEIAASVARLKRPGGQPHAPGVRPLFICGMFRSGSTLAERVLDSHSKVVGGGELNLLTQLVASRLAPFPQAMGQASLADLATLAETYRSRAIQIFPEAVDAAYLADKRPDNFLLAGLALTLFPDAKVINTVRNPLDVGISIYSHNIDPRVTPYATDLAAIGHYISLYRALMAHWKSRFPGAVHDFDYDAFVREPEPELAKLLAFLGLDWEPECLDFHTRRATVKTASYWQIREPLHARASGRWRNYERHLEPLRRALGDHGG
ncbi:MAG: tetratricopeptide repeat-containing sulfotransferase family protein [Oceanicaulis sp.]